MVYQSIHVTELAWNGLLMYTCHRACLEWFINVYMSQSLLGMVYQSIHVTELAWNGLLMYTCHRASLEWFIKVYMSQG